MNEMVAVELKMIFNQYKEPVLIESDQFYKLVTISNKGAISLREIKQGKDIKANKMYRIKSGSLIYSRLAAHTGSYGLVPLELDGAVVSNEMPVFEINSNVILSKYLMYLLCQNTFLNTLYQLTKGMGRVRIKEDALLKQKISIHKDITKQKKIAGTLDSKCNSLEALVTMYLDQINVLRKLRQAILMEAAEGKLTAEWRRKNPELIRGENHASKLLEKIKAEKELLIKEGKVKKDKPISPVTTAEKPFNLPEGWAWCRFGEYVMFERGRFSIRPRNDKSCYGGDHPFIQIGSLSNDGNVIVDFKQTLNEMGFSVSKQFEKGTIAIAIVGGTIGNLGVLGLDMCFPDSMVGIRPTLNSNQKYVLLLLRSKQPEIRKAAYQMAGQPNIKLPTLTELVVALPPLAEQQAIVKRMEKLLAMIDELEKQVTERKDQSERLMQSILREAFSQ